MPTEEEWEEKFVQAKKLMVSRLEIKKVLIEVAAQHPLIDETKPGVEFTARLLKGEELFHENLQEGMEVEIYVPGSLHMWEGIVDKIPLSEAGVRFLEERGLPREALHGEDLNQRYKGNTPLPGVYNSADECFVAANYFRDRNFGRLCSVVSPNQLNRKTLHYIWFGIIPLFYTATTQINFHDPVFENFHLVPYVLNVDPDWQSIDSYQGNLQRQKKDPRFLKV